MAPQRLGRCPLSGGAGRLVPCLGVEEAEGMEDVLAAFGTTREPVESLGEQLAEETRDHGRG